MPTSPQHRRLRRLAIATVAATLVAAACSGGDDSPAAVATVPSTTATTAPATTVAPTTTTAGGDADAAGDSTTTTTTTTLPTIDRQPLTGDPLAAGEDVIDRPALAVKIDNAPPARPNHSGLAVADIVFEEIVEGDITRFAAVFHSRDSDVVGPIRSGRSQDVDLLASFGQPLFAWSGGNAGVTQLIAESNMVDLNAVRGGEGYYRGPGEQPHDLYNSTERLWEQTPEDHPGAPPQQFEYLRPGETFEGEPVAGVELPMRGIDVEWEWDAEAGRFLRSQEGGAHNDVLHGRIGAENVVVMGVWYRPSAIDARSPEAQTVSQGAPLWVFSNGQLIEGQWIRTDPTLPFQLVDEAFQPIALTPGTTWVELAEAEFSGDAANPIMDVTVIPAE